MDFDDYKQQIDLVDFAQRLYGFRINAKKSTKRHVVLIGAGKDERIIVSRNQNSGHHWYFNPHDDRDKGTVIDFVLQREEGNWQQVLQVLEQYMDNAAIPLEASFQIQASIPVDGVLPHFDLLPFDNRAYLHQRGISDTTIDDPLFLDRIHNVAGGKKGLAFVNTAFSCYNLSGQLLGLEVKNVNYTGHALHSRKSEACWMSRYQDLSTPIAEMVITESAIDGLSYHQLHPPSEDRIYISSGGALVSGQIQLIQGLIHRLKPRKVILAMDNDLAGIRYNLLLLGILEEKEKSYSFSAEFALLNKDRARLLLQIHKDQGELVQQALCKMWEGSNLLTIHSQPYELMVEFPYHREALLLVEQRLLLTRRLRSWIMIHRADGKDFNEDLRSAD